MYEESWRCVERALSINPNDGDIIANRGSYHLFQGDFDEATIWFDEVLELHADTPFTVDIMRFWKALTGLAPVSPDTLTGLQLGSDEVSR